MDAPMDEDVVAEITNRPRLPKKVYDDDTKASALAILASVGGNVSEASRLTDIPARTLAHWRDRPVSGAVRAAQPVKDALLAQSMERILWRLTRAVRGKIGKAKLPAVINGFSHLFDRWRLLQQSTAASTNEALPTINLGNLTSEELRTMNDLIRKAGGSTEGLDEDNSVEVVDRDEALNIAPNEVESFPASTLAVEE